MPQIRDCFKYLTNSHNHYGFFLDFALRDVVKDPDELNRFLVKNLSIPQNLADALMHSTINGSEVCLPVFLQSCLSQYKNSQMNLCCALYNWTRLSMLISLVLDERTIRVVGYSDYRSD